MIKYGSLACDACCEPADIDPIEVIDRWDIPATVLDPAKKLELSRFYLHPHCGTERADGTVDVSPQGYFTASYFDDSLNACRECGGFISDDEYEETESDLCLVCSPY
jgi:hypothetical protein